MPERVTDFSLSVLRISMKRHAELPPAALELLRIYSGRSWAEAGELVFEVASHRVEEINLACGQAAPSTN